MIRIFNTRIVIIPIIVVSFFFEGCGATRRLPKLSQSETKSINRAHFHASIGVKKYKYSFYSELLLNSLRNTKLFLNVDYVENYQNDPDLIAEIEKPYTSKGVVPFLWLLSLGIIPQTVQERYGLVFSIYKPECQNNRIHIEFCAESETLLGIIGVPLAILNPNWIIPGPQIQGLGFLMGDPRKDKRFYDHLSVEIIKHSEEMSDILK